MIAGLSRTKRCTEHRRSAPGWPYHSEHYRALRDIHKPLLKSIEKITGKKAAFIQWNGTSRVN
ncbi:hypothetical protein [Mesorhizobium neociceri]|uniref:Uncharacterized protein n=1 Tax=Mesorhizobium neociceri TaxID=1307853 RepID=A0A838B118_9HYPH|nr:hypothetical protein [Mesorhizobium neociceri]MBA1139773.1 hypothetical protein [Mesorhizobium neociceri]